MHLSLIFLTKTFSLVLEVHLFNTVRDTGKHFVGDGLEHIAQYRGWQMLAKDFDGIALVNVRNIRHVDHCHIHADVAHVRCLLTID